MAENLNDNNQLNSARAVKPGLLSVDMSKFGNLTQEEASFETMDKVQGISDKLDDIQKTLDTNGQIQSVAREGFGAVLTSMGRMSDGMSRSGSAIYNQTDRIARSLEDLINGVSNSFGEIRDILRNMPKGGTSQSGNNGNISEAEIVRPRESITRTPPLPVIDLSGVNQIAPAITMSMDGVAKRIGEGMSSIASQIVSATRLSIESAVTGTKLVPQLEYVGSGANSTSGGMSALIPELVEERGNTWDEFESTSWADSIEKSLQVVSTGVVAVGAVLRQLMGIEQNRDIQAQYRYQLALQAPVRQQVKEETRDKPVTLPPIPQAVKGIAEWIMGLIGLHGPTIHAIMWGVGLISKGIKSLVDWFLATDLGIALTKDIKAIGVWVKAKWTGFVGKIKGFFSGALDDFVKWTGGLWDDFAKWFANSKVGKALGGVKGYIDDALKTAWTAFKSTKIGGFLSGVAEKIGSLFGKFGDDVARFFEGFPLFKNTANWIKGIFGGEKVAASAGKVAEVAGKTGGGFFGKALPVLGAIISAYEAVRRFFEGDYLGAVIEVAAGIASFFGPTGAIVALILTGVNLIRDNWDWLVETVSATFSSIGMFISDTWNSVKSWLSKKVNSVAEWVSEVTKPYVDGFMELYNWVSEWVIVLTDTTIGTIKDAWYGLYTSFTAASEFIWNGITSLASSVYETVRYYIKDWFGIDITKVFTDLYNGISAVWGIAKLAIMMAPSKLSEYWEKMKTSVSDGWKAFVDGAGVVLGYVKEGLLAIPGVISLAWDVFTAPIRGAWKILTSGLTAAKDVIVKGFDLFKSGVDSIAKWLESIDPWEEIENSIKKLGDLIKAIPNAMKRVYNSIIDSMPAVIANRFTKYEIPGEQAELPQEKVSLTSMAEGRADIGRTTAIHEQTLRELDEAKKELAGTSSFFSPYKVQALEAKVKELQARADNEELLLSRYYGTVQAQTVAHSQIAPLEEVRYVPEAITGVPMEAQKMEVIPVSSMTKEQEAQLAELAKEALPYYKEERVSSVTANGVTTTTRSVSEMGDRSLYEGAAPQGVIAEATATNKNAEMLVDMMQKQIDVNGKTFGKCAKAFNDASISLGMASERGHAYEKIAQLQHNKNFEEITSQYRSAEDLKNLPRGAVVVWDKSAEKEYGHVSVALGDGREISDHVQSQITGTDSKGRRYGAYHVFMPKADISASTEEKGIFARMGDFISNWFKGENDNEDLALRENTEAIRANTDASKEQGGISKLLTGALDIMNKGLQGGAKGAGAALMKAEELLFSNSSIFDPNSILAAKPSGTLTVSSLSMMGEGSGRSFVTEAVAEDSTEPVESPLPQTIANQQAEEQRQRELSQRPVTVVAPSVNEGGNVSPVPQPTMNDAYIDDIRLLAINQGLV